MCHSHRVSMRFINGRSPHVWDVYRAFLYKCEISQGFICYICQTLTSKTESIATVDAVCSYMISVEIYDAWKTRIVETQAQIRHPACQIVGLWDATLDATVIILQNLYFSLFILRRLGAKNLSLLVWHLWAESGNCKAWNWSKDQWSHTVHKPKGKSANKAVHRLIAINPVKIKQFNGLFAFFIFVWLAFFKEEMDYYYFGLNI